MTRKGEEGREDQTNDYRSTHACFVLERGYFEAISLRDAITDEQTWCYCKMSVTWSWAHNH
jgi:hypothetical protein